MKYIVIKKIETGGQTILDKNNKSIPLDSVVPQINDTIDGTIETKKVGSNSFTGIFMDIQTNGVNSTANQTRAIFVPAENLKLADDSFKVDYQGTPEQLKKAEDSVNNVIVMSTNGLSTPEKVAIGIFILIILVCLVKITA